MVDEDEMSEPRENEPRSWSSVVSNFLLSRSDMDGGMV